MSDYKTIDQEFEDSYAKKGLQPSVGFSTPIRNVQIKKRESSNKYNHQKSTDETNNDENFNRVANNTNLKAHQKNNSQFNTQTTNQQSHSPQLTGQTNDYSRPQIKMRNASQIILSGKRDIALKIKATAITSSIFAWGGLLWFVQLFFAVFSLVMFGAMSALEELAKEETILSLLLKFGDSIASGIEKVFGINLNIIQMSSNLFMVFSGAVLVIGLITLMGASFQYIFSGIKPLSGEMAGMKIGLFLLAIVGYLAPFLNLLPCALPWVIVVWKYPK